MNYKLIVVVPIRNRDRQLRNLIFNLLPILQEQLNLSNNDIEMVVVEQNENKKFNKGKLLNAAFLEHLKTCTNNNNDNNIYLFHDVDIYPKKINVFDYKRMFTLPNEIHHWYGYNDCLGGFFACSTKTFQTLNGFHNDYYGWGREDEDLEYRANSCNIKINRKNFISRRSNHHIFDEDDFQNENKKKTDHVLNAKTCLRDSKILKSLTLATLGNKNNNNATLSNVVDGLHNCTYKVQNVGVDYGLNQIKITRYLIDL